MRKLFHHRPQAGKLSAGRARSDAGRDEVVLVRKLGAPWRLGEAPAPFPSGV